MKVVLIARTDYANMGAEYAECLKAVGVDATMYFQYPHIFQYPNQGIHFDSDADMIPRIKEATIVHIMHSRNPVRSISLEGKKVVVSHTGTGYREKHKRINKYFNSVADLAIVGGDLGGLGAVNEYYWPGGVVNTNGIKPVYERSSNVLVVGHFPSNWIQTEGDKLFEILKNVSGDFECRLDANKASWEQQIGRMSECDVYLERLSGDKGFGITVLEAAALGKVVLVPYIFEDKYKEATGDFDLTLFDGAEDLVKKVEELISLSDEELLKIKKKSRAWAVKYHSYEAVGKRLLGLYEGLYD